jgi:hypothetical protein
MKYMLLIYHDETEWDALTEAERQEIYLEYRQLIQELQSSGQYLAGDQLQGTNTASSVRVRDGKQLVTDGPFAETREQLGGFFMIEANNVAEANQIAAAFRRRGLEPWKCVRLCRRQQLNPLSESFLKEAHNLEIHDVGLSR